MARTNKDRIGPATPSSARGTIPWVSSGIVTASTLIKNTPGILGGVVVTALDAGADISVIVWDSSDDSVASDIELGKVTITSAVSGIQASLSAPSEVGIEAESGIYVQLVSGDCEIMVYYR